VVEQRGARRRPGHLGAGCLREPDVASKVPPALSLSGRFQTRDVVDRRPQVDPPSLVFTPPSPQRRASVGRQGTLGLELGSCDERRIRSRPRRCGRKAGRSGAVPRSEKMRPHRLVADLSGAPSSTRTYVRARGSAIKPTVSLRKRGGQSLRSTSRKRAVVTAAASLGRSPGYSWLR
jgi:hypothetical protein